MVTGPSEARIAAALALAEAALPVADTLGAGNRNVDAECALMQAARAYRATAPKPLRTRAEVDAEIATKVRVSVLSHCLSDSRVWYQLCELCREPLAPDPTDSGSGRDDDAGPPLVPPSPAGAAFHCARCDGKGYTVSHSTRRRPDVTCGLCKGTGEDPRQKLEQCTCDALKLKPLELCPACPKRRQRSGHGGEADSCDCASRHLKVIGEFEAEAKETREAFARFVYYNFGGWLSNAVDRQSFKRLRHLPESVRRLVECYHEERCRTGEVPGWCKP